VPVDIATLRARTRPFRHALLLVPLLLIAAKCVQRDTLYQDKQGDWIVVGELRNDTDLDGAAIDVGARLLDAEGNVIATGESFSCPTEFPAHSTISFGVKFVNSADRQPASYDVRVIGGHALDAPLADSGLSLSRFVAEKMTGGIVVVGYVAASAGHTYTQPLEGCAVLYGADGNALTQLTLENFGLTLPLTGGTSQRINVALPNEVFSPAAKSIRLWLSSDTDPTTSASIAMTDALPLKDCC
jgi:hypothetical protein